MRSTTKAAGALFAVGALALAGCSSTGSSGGDEGDEISSLTIMTPYFSANAPEADDPVQEALGDLTGININVSWSPNADYSAKINTVLAGNKIPDVMVIQQKDQGFVQTAEAGGFWDLTEYIDSGDYPNLVPATPQVKAAASVNGKLYGIPRERDAMRYVQIIRKDWLKNLDLEVPQTTDEFREIARAFTEDDPDGNGKDDTYGLVYVMWPGIGSLTPMDAVDVWFGAGNTWKDIDGELVPMWDTPEWKESLDFSRDLFESGYTNPDFPTKDGETTKPAFMNGEGGIMIGVSSDATGMLQLLREKDPEHADDYITIGAQPAGPNGAFALPTAGFSGLVSIPKAGVQTEEQLKQVLGALDKMASAEGQKLLANGIEGKNYTIEDGFAVWNEDNKDHNDLVSNAWLQLDTGIAGREYLEAKPASAGEQELYELRNAAAEEDLAEAVYDPTAGLLSQTYLTQRTQLDQIISDARMRYAAGEIDEAGLQDAIDQWHAQGGDTVIQEFNELYAAQQ